MEELAQAGVSQRDCMLFEVARTSGICKPLVESLWYQLLKDMTLPELARHKLLHVGQQDNLLVPELLISQTAQS